MLEAGGKSSVGCQTPKEHEIHTSSPADISCVCILLYYWGDLLLPHSFPVLKPLLLPMSRVSQNADNFHLL